MVDGKLNEDYPLVEWQIGSDTQSNVNDNEVSIGYCLFTILIKYQWTNHLWRIQVCFFDHLIETVFFRYH